MRTGFKVNGVTVFDIGLAEFWSSSMFNQRLLKKFGDELIRDMDIESLEQTTETTNEFLTAAVQRDTPEIGYDKFHLHFFKGLETPLEESVVQRVTEKLTFVKDFKVSTMCFLPD